MAFCGVFSLLFSCTFLCPHVRDHHFDFLRRITFNLIDLCLCLPVFRSSTQIVSLVPIYDGRHFFPSLIPSGFFFLLCVCVRVPVRPCRICVTLADL